MTPATIEWLLVGKRATVIAAALLVWFWTQRLIAARGSPGHGGISDWIHDLTAGWHAWLVQQPRIADRLLIASSLFIDLFGLFMIGASLFGQSFAPFLGILIVFIMRQVSQLMCALPPPPGIIWRDPGVPSLLVTYGVGNDFFFSGHTAFAVLGALEMAHLGPVWLAVPAVVIALAEMAAVIVLRAHYTLDVITGILAALVAWCASHEVAPVLEAWMR
jgi:membrane-associated phospholipid phosphatase